MANIKCRYLDGTSKIFSNWNQSVSDILVNGVSIGVNQATVGSTDVVEFVLQGTSMPIFTNCTGLVSVEIPSGVSEIPASCFYGCTKLASIVIPDSVTSIGSMAFKWNYALTTLNIGSGCTHIDSNAFEGCTRLKLINITSPSCNVEYNTFYNIAEGGTLAYPEGSDYSQWLSSNEYYLGYYGWNVSAEGEASVFCTYSSEEPDTYICSDLSLFKQVKRNGLVYTGYNIVSDIQDGDVFEFVLNTKLLPANAFHNPTGGAINMTTCRMEGVEVIGASAFEYCEYLENVDLGDNVKTIGASAFEGCSKLEHIEFPNTLEYIDTSAFEFAGLKSVVIPDSVHTIMNRAFYGCSNLASAIIGSDISVLKQETFGGCDLSENLIIGNNVTEIGKYCFQGTNIKTLNIPDSVVTIKEGAFQVCGLLTEVNIGSGCTSIGQIAFEQGISTQGNLERINITSPYCSIDSHTFHNVKSYGTLTYPSGADYSQWLSTDNYYLGYYHWNEPTFELEQSSITVPVEGKTFSVGFEKHNLEISNYMGSDDWFSVVLNGDRFDITVERNEGDKREGKITILLNDGTFRYFTIYQEGVVPTFELLTTEVTVNPSGETFTVNYTGTNIQTIDWKISTSTGTDDWVNVVNNNGYFTITVASNTADVRKARVTFTANGYSTSVEDVLVINQQALEKSFTLDNYLITFPSEGGVQDVGYDVVNIWDDITFEAPSWITVTVYNAVFRIEVGRTTSTTGRQGTVTFRTGGFVQELVVKQDKFIEPVITVSKTKIEAPYTGLTETVSYTTQGVESIYIISPNWIDVRDYGTYLEINVKDNAEYEERTGVVEVYGNYESAYEAQARIEVVQEPTPKPVDPDEPDVPDDPNAPSVGSDTRKIVFEASGGTQPIDFTWSNVSYDDISTKAEAADSWVELDYEGLISPNPIITQYLVTAGVNTGAPRTTYFTFTGSTSSGEIKTETITIYQKNNNGDLPNDSDMSTGCYINLDSYEHTFPATGGTISVVAHFGYPSTSGLKARAFSGAVYPILWCTTENVGGGIEDDGTEASEIWEITMTNNNFDAERTATITFSYTNYYGESTSVVFTAKQEAGAGEDKTEPKVGVSSNRLNVNSDGTPEYSSTTNIKGFYQAVTINNPIINGDWIHLGTGVEYEGVIYGYDTRIDYPISFDANDGASRTGTITFSGIDTNGNVLTAVCNVIQASAVEEPDEPETPDIPVDGDEYIGPIWKDVEYNFGGIEMVEYGIYTEVPFRLPGNGGIRYYDKLLFAGRSYARPDTGNNVILVNKICQDYMEIPLLKQGSPSLGDGYNTFKLKSADGNTLYKQYSFVNDWSYGEFETGLLSRPILKDHSKVFRNQLLPFSVFGAAEKVTVPYEIFYADGTKWNSTVYETRGVTTEMFPFEDKKNGAIAYSINNKIYTISDECVQYVLYYVNPWGGYDWFPIRGKVVERDSMTAYTYTQNFNNQTWDFGKRRYLTEITKHFTLHTQWMSEDESSRMWYLLQSNTVYLHNLVEDKIYPVVITNTEQEHKKRLLGTRISYQIEVDLSQNRERI